MLSSPKEDFAIGEKWLSGTDSVGRMLTLVLGKTDFLCFKTKLTVLIQECSTGNVE